MEGGPSPIVCLEERFGVGAEEGVDDVIMGAAAGAGVVEGSPAVGSCIFGGFGIRFTEC